MNLNCSPLRARAVLRRFSAGLLSLDTGMRLGETQALRCHDLRLEWANGSIARAEVVVPKEQDGGWHGAAEFARPARESAARKAFSGLQSTRKPVLGCKCAVRNAQDEFIRSTSGWPAATRGDKRKRHVPGANQRDVRYGMPPFRNSTSRPRLAWPCCPRTACNRLATAPESARIG
jgi:hypothetical protein